MDDVLFPYYCMEYKGLTFSEVHSKWGADAVNKIKTVLSNGIARNFRIYAQSRANNTSLSRNTALPVVFKPSVEPAPEPPRTRRRRKSTSANTIAQAHTIPKTAFACTTRVPVTAVQHRKCI